MDYGLWELTYRRPRRVDRGSAARHRSQGACLALERPVCRLVLRWQSVSASLHRTKVGGRLFAPWGLSTRQVCHLQGIWVEGTPWTLLECRCLSWESERRLRACELWPKVRSWKKYTGCEVRFSNVLQAHEFWNRWTKDVEVKDTDFWTWASGSECIRQVYFLSRSDHEPTELKGWEVPETVLLPTPPLPEATATTCLT